MTKDDVIILLARCEIDQHQTGVWKLDDDMYDLALTFGTDYVWHGRMKGGHYFYFYTDNEEHIEKGIWDVYGERNPKDVEKRDAGFKEYVCLVYLYE